MKKMKIREKNHWLGFFAYFAMNLMYMYTNAYLPIYFEFVLSIDGSKLSLVLLVSYSFLFIKPVLALIIDKRDKTNRQVNARLLLIISILGSFTSFLIFLLENSLLPVFMVFLAINLAFISVIDVVIDKIIVQDDKTNEIKDKNIFFVQMGQIIGAIMPNVYYFILISDKTSFNSWTLFFIVGGCSIIPTLILACLTKASITIQSKNHASMPGIFSKKNIGLLCIFIFLSNSSQLYNWLLEPWAVAKLGPASNLFSLFMIFFIVLNALGLIFAKKKAKDLDREKTLMMVVLISGILLSFAPYLDIFLFMIAMSFLQFILGFYYINLTFLMINTSRKEVLIFQIMSAFSIAARVIFIPLGTFLSSMLSTEMIITMVGTMHVISVIPIYFLKKDE